MLESLVGRIESRLWWLVAVALAIFLRLWAAATFPVLSDEAEFAWWSRAPSWGSAERPPMIAWLLWLSARVVPIGPGLALRWVSVLIGCLNLLVFWKIARELFDRAAAMRVTVVATCVPILAVTGFLMVPEAPLTTFALLFLLSLVRAVRGRGRIWWVAAGCAAGFAILAKLSGFLLVISAAAFLIVEWRRGLRFQPVGPAVALLATLVVISPYLVWDLTSVDSSLRFQLWDRHHDAFGFSLAKLGEGLFEQLVNASPLMLLPLIVGVAVQPRCLTGERLVAWRLTRSLAVLPASFFVACSAVIETHPQWSLVAFPPAILCLCAHDVWRTGNKYLSSVTALSWLLVAIGMVVLANAPETLRRIEPYVPGDHAKEKIEFARRELEKWDTVAEKIEKVVAEFSLGSPLLVTHRAEFATQIALSVGVDRVEDLSAWVDVETARCESEAADRLLVESATLLVTDQRGPEFDALQEVFESVVELPVVELTTDDRHIEKLILYSVTGLSCREEEVDTG